MLKIENITYSYKRSKQAVLSNYSLEVKDGTICGLLGKNGAGKSTLLYLILGLLKPQSGEINYNGFRPFDRKVAFLNDVFIDPEEFYLPNVKLSQFVKSMSAFYPKYSHADLSRHLSTFEMTPDVHLGHLSMGQKKRVFMSFALACNTSLLVLDEPTNGLDIPGKRLFRKAVLDSMTDDRTIIISTHQVYDVEKILDHVVITDTNGVLLNATMMDISSRLLFAFTNNKDRIANALVALDAPGGANIVELSDGYSETDVNLETLFELVRQNPTIVKDLFGGR